MEKGFNDQELADIMSEIESLEKEFADEAEAPASAMAEQEVLQELVENDEPVMKTNHESSVLSMSQGHIASSASSSANTSMQFKVEGQMSIQLTFTIDGKDVGIMVSGDELTIKMDNGAKFSLPVNAGHAFKKSA